MEAWNAMSLALEWTLAPARGGPSTAPAQSSESRLEISVVFTSVECTLPALKKAAALAYRLHARITLLVPQVVPYRIPLTSPPILLDFSERRFRIIAAQSPVETRGTRISLPGSPERARDDAQAPVSRRSGRTEAVVAYRGKEARAAVAARRTRSRIHGNGVIDHARSVLSRHRLYVSAGLLGLHQGLRQAVEER